MLQKIKEKLEQVKGDVYFDEDNHLYYVKGEEYTSVSNTLSWFKKSMDSIPKQILENAIVRGKAIHAIAEQAVLKYGLLCGDKLDEFKGEHFREEWEKYLTNLMVFYHEKHNEGWEVLAVEQVMYDSSEKVAGTADLILVKNISGTQDHILINIVDYKTGALRSSNTLQVSYYALMLDKHLKRLKMPIKVITELISLKD